MGKRSGITWKVSPIKKKQKVRDQPVTTSKNDSAVRDQPVAIDNKNDSAIAVSVKDKQGGNTKNDSAIAVPVKDEQSKNTKNNFASNPTSDGILTSKTFKEFDISELTLKAVEEMEYTHMSKIQAACIPLLLEGQDVVAAAKTGSGKTLTYLIPAIELLHKMKFEYHNGTGVIVVAPTRELAMQIFTVLRELTKHHNRTIGLIHGQTNVQIERKKLSQGINILVATPGRLNDHLQNSKDFVTKNLQCLIIDEADRLLDEGFEDEMKRIIRHLPRKRQNVLMSATLNSKTEDLVSLVMGNKVPTYIGVDDEAKESTVEGLQQGYVVCPLDKKFLLLFTFLKKNRKRKVMVFMSSCASVKFYCELLNYIDIPCMALHGKQNQATRSTSFFKFCAADSGTLLCTNVGARGLDIPAVDWIVQFEPPGDAKEYIHRVGRTARGLGAEGNALIILTPDEQLFLHYLKEAKVPITEFEFSWSKISNIQMQLEKLVSSNHFLCMAAKDAYKSSIQAYSSYSLKDVFDVKKLDLVQVAKTFGLVVAPHVHVGGTNSHVSRHKRKY